MIKWIFKSVFRLLITLVSLAVVVIIVLLLSYNSVLRVLVEHQIRAQTGMDAEIGSLKIALTSPTIRIQNFKLYNSSDFGGTPFLDIPEIYIEYDRVALMHREIHVTLLRFNLGEFDIVKNQAGQTNIFTLGLSVPAKKSGGGQSPVNFKRQTGYDFKGIDALNISIGKAKFIDLKEPQNNLEQNIGIENLVIPNVKSEKDLVALGVFIGLKSGGFFNSLTGQKSSGADILKLFGQ